MNLAALSIVVDDNVQELYDQKCPFEFASVLQSALPLIVKVRVLKIRIYNSRKKPFDRLSSDI